MGIDFNKLTGKVKPPTKLAHVVLRTNCKPAMTEFYIKFLGAHVVYENAVVSFLTYEDENRRIAILTRDLADEVRRSCGLEHIAFTYNSISDLLDGTSLFDRNQPKLVGVLQLAR